MRTPRALALASAVLLALAGCALPGTGTLQIYNDLTEPAQITALYVYPTGSPNTTSIIASPLAHGKFTTRYGVAPGATTIEAQTDGGRTALATTTVEAGHFMYVYITDAALE